MWRVVLVTDLEDAADTRYTIRDVEAAARDVVEYVTRTAQWTQLRAAIEGYSFGCMAAGLFGLGAPAPGRAQKVVQSITATSSIRSK